jgi:carbon storage regulator
MLVLSRKRGERIVLPHCEVAITVVEIKGNQVRLGIAAPPALAVYRQETWHRLGRQRYPSPAKK